MVAHPCVVDGNYFATKKDLEKHTKFLIDKIPKNSPIEKGHNFYNFFKCLFERHPVKDSKNIYNFIKVGDRDLVYNDSHTFSWKKCISQKDDSPRQKYIGALRASITDQIKEQREYSCSKCGLVCRCEVDHILPFKDIVKQFEAEYDNIDLDELKYEKNATRFVGKQFDVSDEYTQSMVECFSEYHRKVATYQSLCSTCHKEKTYA